MLVALGILAMLKQTVGATRSVVGSTVAILAIIEIKTEVVIVGINVVIITSICIAINSCHHKIPNVSMENNVIVGISVLTNNSVPIIINSCNYIIPDVFNENNVTFNIIHIITSTSGKCQKSLKVLIHVKRSIICGRNLFII